MDAHDSICVYVGNTNRVTLTRIIHDKLPRPFGLYFGLSEIAEGSLNKELLTYGCSQKDITTAIDAVMKADYNKGIII